MIDPDDQDFHISERLRYLNHAFQTVSTYVAGARECFDDKDAAKILGIAGGLGIAADIAREHEEDVVRWAKNKDVVVAPK